MDSCSVKILQQYCFCFSISNKTTYSISLTHFRDTIGSAIKRKPSVTTLLLFIFLTDLHCVKSVRIWSFSGPHFPAFGLNTERTKYEEMRYFVSLRIQSECGKTRTRRTPNTDTFYAV